MFTLILFMVNGTIIEQPFFSTRETCMVALEVVIKDSDVQSAVCVPR